MWARWTRSKSFVLNELRCIEWICCRREKVGGSTQLGEITLGVRGRSSLPIALSLAAAGPGLVAPPPAVPPCARLPSWAGFGCSPASPRALRDHRRRRVLGCGSPWISLRGARHRCRVVWALATALPPRARLPLWAGFGCSPASPRALRDHPRRRVLGCGSPWISLRDARHRRSLHALGFPSGRVSPAHQLRHARCGTTGGVATLGPVPRSP